MLSKPPIKFDWNMTSKFNTNAFWSNVKKMMNTFSKLKVKENKLINLNQLNTCYLLNNYEKISSSYKEENK